ncbi:MAG: tRNA (adenosine(37)-N6)-dimethylallyltransferase MiaA [Rickettsiales bacterium]|nr:tRNA (adenosine(37)-N6)-dimethylallyltransferase MiaA [Rickettsiales bacterium]
MNHKKVLVISGPTASGKSYLAEQLLECDLSGVIVNADSMQVYKDLPILSGQPNIQVNPSIYRLYSFLDFDQNCSVGLWQEHAHKVINKAFEEKILPIVVGGTGLYIKALIEGIANIPDISSKLYEDVQKQFLKLGKEKFYAQLNSVDPVSAKKIHSSDSYRMQRAMAVYMQTGRSISDFKASKPSYIVAHVSILPKREVLYNNCDLRFRKMMDLGAEHEVKLLFGKIKNKSGRYNIENTLGYRDIVSYLKKDLSLEEAILRASQMTRNYAKRQYTWFKNQFPNKITLSYDTDVKEVKEKFFQVIKRYLKEL